MVELAAIYTSKFRLLSPEDGVVTENRLRWRDRGLTVLGGFLFILLVTLIAVILDAETSTVPLFDTFVRPFTLAAAGIGTGHYLGRAIREDDNIRMHVALGFFLGIFLVSIYYTAGESVVNIPYPALVVISALFAIVMHYSPVIPKDEGITEIMHVFGGPVTTGFLVIASGTKFIVSLNPSWIGAVGAILFSLIAITTGAYGYGLAVESDQNESK